MKKLILFDLDGTLTDSGPGIKKCVQYGLEKCGYPLQSDPVLQSFIGPPLLHQYMTVLGMSREEAKTAIRFYRERYAAVGIYENSLYGGVPEMLAALREENYLLGVTSAKPLHFVHDVLEYFTLRDRFDVIQGAMSDQERPNKVDVIERTLSEIGYESRRDAVWLVGDRKYDAAGAKLCGIGFYGAGWGYAQEGELEAEGAQKIADSPEDLVRMILAEDRLAPE